MSLIFQTSSFLNMCVKTIKYPQSTALYASHNLSCFHNHLICWDYYLHHCVIYKCITSFPDIWVFFSQIFPLHCQLNSTMFKEHNLKYFSLLKFLKLDNHPALSPKIVTGIFEKSNSGNHTMNRFNLISISLLAFLVYLSYQ